MDGPEYDDHPSIDSNTASLGQNNNGTDKGWYTRSVTARYPIEIKAYEKAQKLKLEVTLNRYDTDENEEQISQMGETHTIDWGGLDTDLGQPVRKVNDDNSVTYTFTKGTDSNIYNENNVFSVNKKYNVYVTYQTSKSNPVIYGSEAEDRSVFDFNANLQASGYKIEENYNTETKTIDQTVTYEERSATLADTRTTSLYLYTPGEHTWINIKSGSAKIGNQEYQSDKIDSNIAEIIRNGNQVEIKTIVNINKIGESRKYNSETGEFEDWENITGQVDFGSPIMKYIQDGGRNGSIGSIGCTYINLKSIKPLEGTTGITTCGYYTGSASFQGNETFVCPDSNRTGFSLYLEDYLNKEFTGYEIVYTVDLSDNPDIDGFLDKILSLSIHYYKDSVNEAWIQANDDFIIYGPEANYDREYSDFTVDEDRTDSLYSSADMLNKWENKRITLAMKKINYDQGQSDKLVSYATVNENPVFYVPLPSSFSYKNISATTSSADLAVKRTSIRKYGNTKYLVIECNGVYDSRKSTSASIVISYSRKLTNDVSVNYSDSVYMFTDNENYWYQSQNELGMNKDSNGVTPEYASRRNLWSGVTGSSKKEASTTIEKDNKEYKPNPSNTIDEDAEKQYPLIVESNKRVTFNSGISAENSVLTNMTILTRLPFADNTLLYKKKNPNTEEYEPIPIIESTYKIENQDFWNRKGANVNGVASGDVVPHISLTDLQIEGVYTLNHYFNSVDEIDSSKYTIYYSTQADADFESDTFTQYNPNGENVNFNQAKNIKVVFNEGFQLQSGTSAILKYSMKMPAESGMTGGVTAVKYTSGATEDILYSPVAYVINGNETVNIELQKKFENLPIGTAPSELENGLANIKFRLLYFNETTGDLEVLKDSSNNEIIATTDSNGIAKFTNIPAREYVLDEVTTFDNYSKCDGILYDVEPGDTINASENIVVNPLKRSTVTIDKLWNGHVDASKPAVTLKLSRKNENGDELIFNKTATLGSDGKAVFNNIPYGDYTITETRGTDGWTPEVASKDLAVYAETVQGTFNNIPSKATLKIVKSVPRRESVDGLTFKITGRGKVTYLDEHGEEQTTDSETIVKIGDETTYGSNVTVEKSNNDTIATITISDLYLGLYTIEEIDIPTISGIAKYPAVTQYATLSTQGSTVTVDIVNNYKYGTLEINKTAKLKDKDTYTDMGGLETFQIRVHGTSLYGNSVDEVIPLDVDGHGAITLEIGTYTVEEVKDIPFKGFTAYYETDGTYSKTAPQVTVKYDETVTQNIYNEFDAVGYVRVEKSLEGITNPEDVEKIKNMGIKFAVIGKNVAGQSIGTDKKGEIIEINQYDPDKNVAYGISGPIPAYGDYAIEEVESTVPEFYEGEAAQEIEITADNTLETPLVIDVTNKKGKGNLEIVTKTDPEGGPLTGIKYKVTKVKINNDGTYVKLDEGQSIFGSNDVSDASFAELTNIDSGYYLVEQEIVPDGWIKDLSQVVEVPNNSTGYAVFEITQKRSLKPNKVFINKVVLNKNGQVATEEEIRNAKLNLNEEFEVKLVNVGTGAEYYVFTSVNNPGVIQGLEAGTYRIEEVNKPKYITEGYYKNIEVPGEIEGAIPTIEQQKIELTEGQGYLFTVTEDENTIQNVTLTIKNTIDTDFGFGGQSSANNLSKIDTSEGQVSYSSRAIIYVVDENDKAVSGVKFSLYNSEGNIIVLNTLGSVFEVSEKKLTIKGLPVGKYTLKCVECPNEFLAPADKTIYVFGDAAQVGKVEVQKNIPRGTINLSAMYQTINGESKYVTRSKYKIVDSSTGELVKFTKTATGDYQKSNLDDANPIITLKTGSVELSGLEVGKYEIGLVDVQDGFGVINSNPTIVELSANEVKNVVIDVAKLGIVKVDQGMHTAMYLNEAGQLYIAGYSAAPNSFANGTSAAYTTVQFEKIKFPVDNVKIEKYIIDESMGLAIDSEQRLWYWGYDRSVFGMSFASIPKQLIPNGSEGKFVDAQASCTQQTGIALDSNGRVWVAGRNKTDSQFAQTLNSGLSLITDFENGENRIIISKLAKLRYNSTSSNPTRTTLGVIDSTGRLWTWGKNPDTTGTRSTSDVPVCISDNTEMKNVKDALITNDYAMALDNDGNVWVWGSGNASSSTWPTKMDSSLFNDKKIKQISGMSDMAIAIDEDGNVWTWGSGYLGHTNNQSSTSTTPKCITGETGMLKGKVIKDIEVDSTNSKVMAVDENDNLWIWGNISYLAPEYDEGSLGKLSWKYERNLEYNLKFKDVLVSFHYGPSYFAIDDIGRVWSWGGNSYGQLGTGDTSNYVSEPRVIDMPSNIKIKKVASQYMHTLMLSEDGRVFYCGRYNYNVKEITNSFGLQNDNEIVDIICAVDNQYALDSNGKVYSIKTSSGGNVTVQCISNDAEGDIVRDNAKIIKITSSNSNCVYALSEEGKVYYINTSSSTVRTPRLCEIDASIVDIANNYALDSNGRLWTYPSPNDTTQNYEQYNTYYNGNPLEEFYNNDSNYKVLKLYCGPTTTIGRNVIVRDSNDKYWHLEGSSAPEVQIPIKNYQRFSYDYSNLDIMLVIDEYGQIWECTSTGTARALTENQNPMYDIKIKHIFSNTYVSDLNNNLYAFNGSGKPVVVGISPSDYMKDSLTIDQIIEDATESVAVDSNGKLWFGTTSGVTCYSDDTESELGAKYTNSNFKIVKIFRGPKSSTGNDYDGRYWYYRYYAVDNEGKLWQWGNGTGTAKPTLLCDLGSTDITKDASFETIVDSTRYVYILKSNNGNVWVWGTNANGRLGNGTTSNVTSPYHINDAISTETERKYIKDISFSNNSGIILCTDGSIYVAGKAQYNTETSSYINATTWTYVDTVANAEKVKATSPNSSSDTYMIVVNNQTTNSKELWTFGYNYYNTSQKAVCGLEDNTSKFINTPQKSMDLNADIVDFVSTTGNYSGSCVIMLDESGKLYQWLNDSTLGRHTFSLYDDIASKVEEMYGAVNHDNLVKVAGYIKGSGGTYYDFVNGKIITIITSSRKINSYSISDFAPEGKTIVEYVNGGKALASDNTLYVWGSNTGLYNSITSPVCTTTRNEYNTNAPMKANNVVINVPEDNALYGVKFDSLINDKFAIDKNGAIWYFTVSGPAHKLSGETITYKKENVNTTSTVAEVVGENEVRMENGDIVSLVPTGTNTWTYTCVDEATEYTTATSSTPISIDEVVIKNQTPHKALGTNGKLYVWGQYTGIEDYKDSDGIVCLTEEQYTVRPVYSHTNGWVSIQATH